MVVTVTRGKFSKKRTFNLRLAAPLQQIFDELLLFSRHLHLLLLVRHQEPYYIR